MNRVARLGLLLFAAITALVMAACDGAAQEPDILFLRSDEAGQIALYRQSGPSATPRVLSNGAGGDLLDFAAAPDGRHLVYSVAEGTRGALRVVDADGGNDRELLACPEAECSAPVWAPDGRRLIYERRARLAGGALSSPRLYWLDPATGETRPLIEGDETPGYGARFSPDGAWLSYVSPGDAGVVLYRLADGEQRLLSSRVGRPVAFSPDGRQVVVGDIYLSAADVAPEAGGVPGPVQESSNVYLYLYMLASDPTEANRQRLSPEAAVDDSAAAWSPDGVWIAFGRAPAGAATGRQLWLMRADGRDARPLTSAPAITHGPPAWSPDGRYLLFQRFDLDDPAATPDVWRLRVDDGRLTLVARGGYLPAWLP